MNTRRVLRAAAGPALIVALVLFAMRGFVFRDVLSDQHPDILAFWLPRWCYLGHSLRTGHVPVWNSLQFAGSPFAADPQSGWLYLPVMGLFSSLSCGSALRAFIVLQPLMAGLGLFWFLRVEGLQRVAATAGGMSAAMLIATSNVGLSLPFDAMLAWTPFLLVGAAGYLRAPTWPRRFGWLALAAVAWGQIASAHMSHGLAMASLTVAAYLVVRSVWLVRRDEIAMWRAMALVVGFAAFLVVANAAILLPRMSLLDRTSLRGGYAAIGGAAAAASGLVQRPLSTGGFWSGWPLALGSTPGAYAGAGILLAVPAAARARERLRSLAIAFAATGLAAYVLTLNALVDAKWFRDFVLKLPFGDVYLHNVGRLRYVMLLIVPVLGALGIQSFLDRPISFRAALAWVGGGATLWLGVPLVVGAHPVRFIVLAVAVAVAAPMLVWLARTTRRARMAAIAVVAVLALELFGSAVYSQAYSGGTVFLGLEPNTLGAALIPQPLRWPDVSVGEYLEPSPIVRVLKADPGRFYTWDPPEVFVDKGYLYEQGPDTWAGLENSRGLLFGLQDPMGYSPVQLTRYWSWIRAVNDTPVFYNASVLHHPTANELRTLGVRWVIVPEGVRPPVAGQAVITYRGYTLYRFTHQVPTVSVFGGWQVVPAGAAALDRVSSPAFDSLRQLVLQRDPGLKRGPPRRSEAVVTSSKSSDIKLRVDATVPSIVLIRNSFDPDWSYSIDGGPTHQVLAADYFLQGVPVPAGTHRVELRYDDPKIGLGILLSAAAWVVLLIALVGAAIAGRRKRSYSAGEPSTGSGSPAAVAAGTGSTGA